MARWRVDLIRKRAEHLGTVTAKTEKEAIAVAIVSPRVLVGEGRVMPTDLGVEPARQNRVAVSKISNRDDD